MKKILIQIISINLALLLTGCSWIMYKPSVQQGNMLTPEQVSQLKLGMTEEQVRYIMGSPVLENTFETNRWHYVYSLQPNGNKSVQERVSLVFANGTLQSIDATSLAKTVRLQ